MAWSRWRKEELGCHCGINTRCAYVILISTVLFWSRVESKRLSVMDPHSRLSQFNQRSPSAGPSLLKSRFTDSAPKHGGKTQKTPLKTATATAGFSSPYMRPMATNSRVKQDVKYKSDIYLSFVSNAMQQKAQVRTGIRRSPFKLKMPCS
jgi:hypothetical protein